MATELQQVAAQNRYLFLRDGEQVGLTDSPHPHGDQSGAPGAGPRRGHGTRSSRSHSHRLRTARRRRLSVCARLLRPGTDPLHPIDNPTNWVAKQIAAYVASDGEKGSQLSGAPLLLLTTKGTKSGLWRRTALIFGEEDGRYLVVASQGGAPRHPSWYLNLQARPEVQLQVFDQKFRATAHTATDEEKPALWARMVEIWPHYAEYQKKTERQIPVVILDPER